MAASEQSDRLLLRESESPEVVRHISVPNLFFQQFGKMSLPKKGNDMKAIRTVTGYICLATLLVFASNSRGTAEEYRLSKAQTLYVPVYSNVFSAPKQVPFYLATILSIRNTDMKNQISVIAADYYDTKGKLLKRYYQQPMVLAPLESAFIYLPEDDTAGGFGANFIVKWTAGNEVNAPIIECVMIGAKSGQGISFVSPGQVIKE